MESWKIVNGFPLYRVSNYGRVKSFWSGKWIILNGTLVNNGYMHQSLKHIFSKSAAVHRLVLEAFVGSCPKGMQANHKDGNKTNNNLSNLEWVTPGENLAHAYRIGLVDTHGERHSRAKWKDGEIWLLKKMLFFNINKHIISKMFKMSIRNINRIAHGDRWSHIVYASNQI